MSVVCQPARWQRRARPGAHDAGTDDDDVGGRHRGRSVPRPSSSARATIASAKTTSRARHRVADEHAPIAGRLVAGEDRLAERRSRVRVVVELARRRGWPGTGRGHRSGRAPRRGPATPSRASRSRRRPPARRREARLGQDLAALGARERRGGDDDVRIGDGVLEGGGDRDRGDARRRSGGVGEGGRALRMAVMDREMDTPGGRDRGPRGGCGPARRRR